jgi:glycosyltransferase involved in cell wall biosynthesis
VSAVRALLVAFEFPPLASGGVHRALALAEHLGACGIDLSVVTVRPEDYAAWSSGPLDAALAARIPAAVTVHRTPSGFPDWYWRLQRSRLGFRALQYAHRGDPVSSFWYYAVDAVVAAQRPDVLLATMPPFGVGVIARQLARRYRLPWVADWRDPWTYWGAAPFPTYAHFAYARSAEGAALREANVSVATSHVTRDDWLHYFRGVDPSRLVTIYNGYDAEVLGRVEPAPRDGTRTIVYAGSWYYDPRSRATMMQPAWRRAPQRWLFYTPRREDWLYRSPWFFLKGLARSRVKPRVEFVGAIPPWLPAMLRETGTESLVRLRGLLPHDEVLRLEKSADALLLTSAKVHGGRDYSIAGKTFEYFGLRRPILGVLTDGAMRDLVDQSGLGLLADPDDSAAVAAAIDAPWAVTPRDDVLARFTRREMARQMAECLKRAAAEGYRG